MPRNWWRWTEGKEDNGHFKLQSVLQWRPYLKLYSIGDTVIGERRTGNDLEGNDREIVPALTCKGWEPGQ